MDQEARFTVAKTHASFTTGNVPTHLEAGSEQENTRGWKVGLVIQACLGPEEDALEPFVQQTPPSCKEVRGHLSVCFDTFTQ